MLVRHSAMVDCTDLLDNPAPHIEPGLPGLLVGGRGWVGADEGDIVMSSGGSGGLVMGASA